jgi:D-alanyl-D-alanine carboxypeptidase (penicillin-binding protein 5/6)
MFTYAFNHYQVFPLYKKGEVVQQLMVDKGREAAVNVVTPRSVSLLAKKGETPDMFQKEIVLSASLHAPIKRDDVVGHIFIRSKDGKEISRFDLFPEKTIDQAGMWEILKRTTRKILLSYQ